MNFIHYKKPPLLFGNLSKIKNNLTGERQAFRRQDRDRIISKNRNFRDYNITKQEELKMRLMKWKTEQKEKKQMKKLQKKPPFVVSIVRHRLNSPFNRKKFTVIKKTKKERVPQTKDLKITKGKMEKQKAITNNCNLPLREQKSFVPCGHNFKPPTGLPTIVIVGENIEVETVNKSNDNVIPLLFFSPKTNIKESGMGKSHEAGSSDTTKYSPISQFFFNEYLE